MKIETCHVGLFRLPGVVLDSEEVTALLIEEMDAWAKSQQGTGTRMTEVLWSFKTEAQRDWFILKWGER